ncbi:MAG: glycoside hydrolase family 2 TIM barrel-domain containing protein [Kiritimatiellia bacterium]
MPVKRTTARNNIDLSADWFFRKGKMRMKRLAGKNPPNETTVNLPHCWNAEDTFCRDAGYYRGYGSYLKFFEFPAAGAESPTTWFLESEGFYGTGDVWINGVKVSEIDGQYLGFRLDVTRYLRPGVENVCGIRLTNRCARHVLPGIRMPDFILYGGLSGRVRLAGMPAVHVEDRQTYIRSEIRGDAAFISIDYSLRNASRDARECGVDWRIEEAGGKTAASAEEKNTTLPPGEAVAGRARCEIHDFNPWSPAGPALYRARCRISEGATIVDESVFTFGIREAEFRKGKGFFLNGERVDLRGANRHESMPGFGNALPPSVHRMDAELLKETGCNFVRLSHYPQSPHFLNACDELGIMVYAEIASWKSVREGRWLESACRQMKDMITRDRNHPSIILWGMGNESRSAPAYRRLKELARETDPSRPVIYAENHLSRARKEKTTGIPDVWGANYEIDILDALEGASPSRCVIVSEYANSPHARRGDLEAEYAQVKQIEEAWQAMGGREFTAGHLFWSFNDYATMRKRRYRRFSGLVDAWRVPKMSAALFRAGYTGEPFVRVFGDWGRNGGPRRRIYVFTNCSSAEISVNGKRVEELRGGISFCADIDFEPGILAVRGERGGGKASDSLEPYGEASSLEIRPGETRGSARERETIVFEIRVLDAEGRHVTSWNGDVSVSCSGPATVKSCADEGIVRVDGGSGRIFLAGTGRSGTVTVECGAGGLETGSARVEFI